MRNRGFTLYELLVVICIIMIMASIPSPRQAKAHPARVLSSHCKNNLRDVAHAIQEYQIANGALEEQLKGGEIPYARLTTPVAYLSDFLADPFKVKTMRSYPRLFGFPFPALRTVTDNLPGFVALTTVILAGMVWLEWVQRFTPGSRWRTWPPIALAMLVVSLSTLLSFSLLAFGVNPIDGGTIQPQAPPQWEGKYAGYYYFSDGKGRFVLQSVGCNLRRDFVNGDTQLSESTTSESAYQVLGPYTYDPTNGEISDGDLFAVRWSPVSVAH